MRLRALLFAVLVLPACTRLEAPRAAPAAPPPPPAPGARSFHDFTPSLHGFQFRNGFQGSVVGTGESAFGLCGGMSFAAADYYLARVEPPRDSRPPRDGTPLFDYLYTRQARSFGTLGAMGLKFVEWMQLPDAGPDSAHARTLAELPAITRALGRGEPVVLGLVLVRSGGNAKAWDNHQVLAFASSDVEPVAGAERPVVSPSTVIRIYDPNFPGRDDVTISIGRSGDDAAFSMHVPGRRDLPIRGMFRMAYTPVRPPGSP